MGEDEGRAVMADVLAALCYMHEKVGAGTTALSGWPERMRIPALT